jgi:hypothetical protein
VIIPSLVAGAIEATAPISYTAGRISSLLRYATASGGNATTSESVSGVSSVAETRSDSNTSSPASSKRTNHGRKPAGWGMTDP